MDAIVPRHVGMIMDGNGRWASNKGRKRTFGHEQASATVREIIKHSVDIHLECLTLYAFSTENWTRPQEEVVYLMQMLESFLRKESSLLQEHNIRLRWLGRRERVPVFVRERLLQEIESTAENTGLNLSIAIDYGGKDELVRATRRIAEKVRQDRLELDDIDEDCFRAHLDTAQLPDVDLVVRTSGEIRISNFLLWQSAYAEYYFTETLWPDFSKEEFEKALKYFSGKKRRLGGS